MKVSSPEQILLRLEALLPPGTFNQIRSLVFLQAWDGKGYAQIAEEAGYDTDYIKGVAAQLWRKLSETFDEKVTKKNFRSLLLQRFSHIPSHNIAISQPLLETSSLIASTATRSSQAMTDWGEAPDISSFFGRVDELNNLGHRILADRCHMMVILGRGGIGKTTLSLKLVQQLEHDFDYIIWRSLRAPSPLQDLLGKCIPILSSQKYTETTIRQLIKCFRESRCLLMLDNVESILEPGQSGQYREGFEHYGDLFRVVGETPHQSCLILTSREKPPEVAVLEGDKAAVQTFQVSGSQEAAMAIVDAKGLEGTTSSKEKLCEYYGHSPLAIKIVSTSIHDLFDGDIGEFLTHGTIIFNGIRRLFHQQFARLSSLEHSVMVWLAINQTWTSIAELHQDLMGRVTKPDLFEALEALTWRSLVEQAKGKYSLQPVLLEYVLDQWVERLEPEFVKGNFEQLSQFTLIKATAREDVQQSQIYRILGPVVQRLQLSFPSDQLLEDHTRTLLEAIKKSPQRGVGYEVGNLINLMQFLQIDMSGWDFSQCFIRQADLRSPQHCGINFSAATFDRTAFLKNFGGITRVLFLPQTKPAKASSQTLVTSDTQGQLQVWQLPEGKLIKSIDAHHSWIWAIAIDKDAQHIATAGEDRVVRIWNIQTWTCQYEISVECQFVWDLHFSPIHQTLAIAGSTSDVLVWDWNADQLKHLEGHSSYIQTVRFSSDGQSLLSGSYDQTIQIWDGITGEHLDAISTEHGLVYDIRFHPDGKTFVTVGQDGVLRNWTLSDRTCTFEGFGHQGLIYTAAFSPDGRVIATAGFDRSIRLWDMQQGKCLRTLQGHQDWVLSVTFGSEGKILASGSADQTLRLWDMQTGNAIHIAQGYINYVYSLAWNSHRLVSGNTDGLIRIWDVDQRRCLKSIKVHESWIWSVAWHPEEHLIASGAQDGTIQLWDEEKDQQLSIFQEHQSAVFSLSWHPSQNRLASGSLEGSIRLWDIPQRQCIAVLGQKGRWVMTVAWSPDGDYLASGGSDGSLCIWDMHTYECVQSWVGHEGYVWSVSWHPNGQWLLSGGSDHRICRWDITTGDMLMCYEGHQDQVTSIQVNASGELFVSGGFDHSVRVWRTESGECERILTGHSDLVLSVLFSDQLGEIAIASGGEDGTIRLWNATDDHCLGILQPKQPYEGFQISDVSGLTAAQLETLRQFGAVE